MQKNSFETNITENSKIFDSYIKADVNFDIICRAIDIDGHMGIIYCIDGLTKDEILEKLLEFIVKQTQGMSQKGSFPQNIYDFSKLMLPYCEISIQRETALTADALLMGQTVMLIDGYDAALIIDCRTYPARNVSEPEKDKTMRGAKDGFVETLVFNTALIRRRIRDNRLTMEMHSAGKRSKTDICICYIEGLEDTRLLNEIKDKIDNIEADALTMGQESLAEAISRRRFLNPFPKFKFTERPDAAAAAVLEGNIIILVDNSPSAMILPSSVFDIIEEADDYYFPPVTGTYLRITRTIISLLTFLIPVFYLYYSMNPQDTPLWLKFAGIKDTVNVPVIVQLLILELALDALRLASVNTPSMLSTPLSITAGLVLGDFSVKTGWFNSQSMLCMAFVFVANYSQSSYEFGYAVKFFRIITLILTAILGRLGLIAGISLFIISLIFNKTVSGYHYLYPLIPFSKEKLMQRFIRRKLR